MKYILAGLLSFITLLLLIAATAPTPSPLYTVMVDAAFRGQEPAINFTNGGCLVFSALDNAAAHRVDITVSPNSACFPTLHTLESGPCTFIHSTNGTSAYTYSFGPIPGCQAWTSYGPGPWLIQTDAPCTSGCTLDVENLGLRSIKLGDGTTDPTAVNFLHGTMIWFDAAANVFKVVGT